MESICFGPAAASGGASASGREKALLSHCVGLDLKSKLKLARQLALQLGCIHSSGYLHLRLTPENVSVEPDSDKVTLRCPLRRAAEQGEERDLFTAPEQFKGREENRTDIYALGVLMRLMLFGSIGASEGVEILELPELSEEGRKVLDGILQRCLAPRPAGRYSCCEELAEGLEALMDLCPD